MNKRVYLEMRTTGSVENSGRFWLYLTTLCTALALIALPDIGAARPQSDLAPGVVATYRSGGIVLARVEPRPAFYLADGQTPHPEALPGQWSGHWVGRLRVLRPGAYRFSAYVRGRVRVTVAGTQVLNAASDDGNQLTAAPSVQLPAGDLPFLVYYESPRNGYARLQLLWESDEFGQEPIPSSVLFHDRSQEDAAVHRWQLIERGRTLVEQLNCAGCHGGTSDAAVFVGTQRLRAPDLTGVGERLKRAWMYHWILSPSSVRSDTNMPDVLHRFPQPEVAARAVVEYLAGDVQEAPQEANEGLVPAGETLYRTVGCAACHESYTDRAAVYELLDLRAKYSLSGLTTFLKDPRLFHPWGAMPSMLLSDAETQALAHYLFLSTARSDQGYELPELPSVEALVEVARVCGAEEAFLADLRPLEPVEAASRVGRLVVQTAGCLQCHMVREGGKELGSLTRSIPLDVAKPDTLERGCLAAAPGSRGQAPVFAIRDEDRAAIRAFLTRPLAVHQAAPSPLHALPRAIQRLNCVRCHRWQGEGGLPIELVDDLRERFGADHAEAVTPPPLTAAGEKLTRDWIRRVLLEGARARPWMSLRMPQFSHDSVAPLVDWFAAYDGVPPEPLDRGPGPTKPELVDAGRLLVGNTGFGCIGCHDIAGRRGEGTRGPDLAYVWQRVRYPWFVRWMRDAQRISPGTRMPTVLPDPVSPLTGVLGGDPRAQIEAIWAYLSLGDKLPLPEGVVPPEGLVLRVGDRPVVLRTFMPEASTRSIAVGLPGGISYVFDAGRGRLAYAWSGDFLDLRPVWTNRGGDPAIVLGPRFWQAPHVFPWAMTGPDELPDWQRIGANPALVEPLPPEALPPEPRLIRFRGYRLDPSGVPVFRVEWVADGGTHVPLTYRITGLSDGAGPGLLVELDAMVKRDSVLWFLAAQPAQGVLAFDEDGRPVDLARQQGELSPVVGYVWSEGGVNRAVVMGAGGRLELLRAGDSQSVCVRIEPGGDGRARTIIGLWAPYSADRTVLRRIVQRTRQQGM